MHASECRTRQHLSPAGRYHRPPMARLKRPPRDSVHEFQPALSQLPYSLPDLVEEVRAEYFPHISAPVDIAFVAWDSLCCIYTRAAWTGERPRIFVHQLLNHPATPREVMRFILKHELLHCVVLPRQIDGRMQDHPPEFWTAEAALGPERVGAWRWIDANFAACLGSDYWGAYVKRNWKRRVDGPRHPYIPNLL